MSNPGPITRDIPSSERLRFSVNQSYIGAKLCGNAGVAELVDFARTINGALEAIEERTSHLLSCTEALSPGSNFGDQKAFHMRLLAQQAFELALSNSGTSPREALLSVLVLRCHDIGRHMQEITDVKPSADLRATLTDFDWNGFDSIVANLDRKDGKLQPVHGLASRRYLEHYDLLASLPEVERTAVLDAIEWHNQNQVGLEKDSLAWRLCYLLRDLDKQEIFEKGSDYLDPCGAVRQLAMHFLRFCPEFKTREEEINKLRAVSPSTTDKVQIAVLKAAHEAISPTTCREKPVFTEPLAWTTYDLLTGAKIFQFSSGQTLEKAVLDFEARKTLNTKPGEFLISYPYYMLAGLAMIFDIQSPKVLAAVVASDAYRARVDYLTSTLPEELSTRVTGALATFLTEKGLASS